MAIRDAGGARCFHGLTGFLATSRLAVRKNVLERVLPLPEELVFAADSFIYILAVAMAGALVLDQPLCFYRIHAGNLWMTPEPAKAQRRLEMRECYVKKAFSRLSKLALPQDAIAALAEP